MLHSSALAQTEAVEPLPDLNNELTALRGENLALQSLLYGLCVALAQANEVQREVIVHALDLAHRAPLAEDDRDCAQARSEAAMKLRSLIMDRIRSFGL